MGLFDRLFDFFGFKRKVHRVVVTKDSIMQFRPDGTQEFMHWDDLVEVGILKTAGGPWAEDVHFILVSSGGKTGISVPQGAEGFNALLAALQKLPGFDNEAVVQAMGSTLDARFVCWQRSVPPCAAPDDGADFSDK